MTDEQIEKALNACTFGQTNETRCKDYPLDSDKEPCITNLHLAALEYIGRLKHRAARAEMAGKIAASMVFDYTYEEAVAQAEKELAEERKDE